MANDATGQNICDTEQGHNDLLPDRSVTTGGHTTWQYQVKGGACVICGEPFDGWHRYNKRTCSDTCRKALARYGERISSSLERGLDIVEFLDDASKVPEHYSGAISALKAMAACISEILEFVEGIENDN